MAQRDRRLLRETVRDDKLDILVEQGSTASATQKSLHVMLLSDVLLFMQLVKDKDKDKVASFVLKCPGRTIRKTQHKCP